MTKTAEYVGPHDLHDAVVSRAQRSGSTAYVHLTSYDGRPIVLAFSDVKEFLCRAELTGHMIYALAAIPESGGLSRFVFVPWEDEEIPRLELVAAAFGEMQTTA